MVGIAPYLHLAGPDRAAGEGADFRGVERRPAGSRRGRVNESFQASLFDFAIRELVRQHRESFPPLWSVESWAKLMIWLALNCGCDAEPAALEGFAAALGPTLTGRMRRQFFERDLEDLNLRAMADPAERQVLLLPLDAAGPPPQENRVEEALERLGLASLTVDRHEWEVLEGLIAVPWVPRPCPTEAGLHRDGDAGEAPPCA